LSSLFPVTIAAFAKPGCATRGKGWSLRLRESQLIFASSSRENLHFSPYEA
jgi:hypothetical protein